MESENTTPGTAAKRVDSERGDRIRHHFFKNFRKNRQGKTEKGGKKNQASKGKNS